MQSPRVPEHVLRRQRRDAQDEVTQPHPYFDEYSRGDFSSPVEDRRLLPDPRVMARNFFPALGRSYDAFANLISPQFLFDRDAWTEEQRAVGRLLSEVPRGMWMSRDPADFLARHSVELPHTTAAIEGFIETTPFGSRGWTGFVDYLEREPLELPLELATLGAARGVTAGRRLMRAARPFDTGFMDDVNVLTGQRSLGRQLADATVQVETLGQRRLMFLGQREVLESGMGFRVGPQDVATASHVITGHLGTGAPGPLDVRRVQITSSMGKETVSGVRGILPEADTAMLALGDVSSDFMSLERLPAPTEILPRWVDESRGAAVGRTQRIGVGGQSGMGFETETGELGLYLGMYGDQGLFATQSTLLDFQRSLAGVASTPVDMLDTVAAVDRLGARGLHYRLARRDPTFLGVGAPFLVGGLGLHGRYGVQEPFSLVRLDPSRHREFEGGPVSGVFAYEGDLRDMLFEIKNPSLNWERRESLLSYLRNETELPFIPDVFREGGYDAITAVPSSVDRLRTRGFNQAEFYAEIFSDVLGIPFERNLLRRTRETVESSKLEGRLSRESNLSGVFVADPSVAGRRILGVDDIVATGTTMEGIFGALRQAGVAETGGLAFASSLHSFQHQRVGLSRFASADTGSQRVWSGVDFTTAQERAISHIEGPAVISAVPGAGKTDVLVERVKRLMAGGVSPSEVLTVAYNRAAVEELNSRFASGGLSSAQARTVHSLAHEIVMDPENFTGVGFSQRPKIARDLTQERFRQMMRQYPDAQVDFEQSEAFRMAGAAETDEDWLTAYRAYKQERGLLTFGQMLDVGAEILETQPAVRQRYLEKYP